MDAPASGRRRVLPPRAVLAFALAVTMTTASLTAGPVPGAAAGADGDRARVQRQIGTLQDDMEGTSKELVAAYAALQANQRRLPGLQAELAAARTAAAAAREAAARAQLRLEIAIAQQAAVTDQLSRSARMMADTSDRVGQTARSMYRSETLSDLSTVLNVTDVDTLTTRLTMYETAARTQNQALTQLQDQQAQSRALQARARAVRAQVEAARREALAQVAAREAAQLRAVAAERALQTTIAQQRRTVTFITARRATEQARLADLQLEKARLDALIRELARRARIKAEQQRREIARQAQARAARERAGRSGARADQPGRPVASTGGPMSLPIQGPITSPYGWRIHPIYGTRRMHTGTDFGAGCGTPVRAPADGVVVRAGAAGGYGNQLVMDLGAVGGRTFSTSFNHLEGFAVRSGPVRRGQVVAYAGTTGASTGCHLHWELYVDGSRVDPMNWI